MAYRDYDQEFFSYLQTQPRKEANACSVGRSKNSREISTASETRERSNWERVTEQGNTAGSREKFFVLFKKRNALVKQVMLLTRSSNSMVFLWFSYMVAYFYAVLKKNADYCLARTCKLQILGHLK